MRIRQILLVHPARSTRALIKKYVFAELSDVEFIEAGNAEDALAELQVNPFDVVVVSPGTRDMSLLELKEGVAETEHNRATPLIVLSEDENGEDFEALNAQGFEHVVALRVRPVELIHAINKVCNPRNWRKNERHYIPGAEVLIKVANATAEAHLINISKGGVLLDLISNDPEILLQGDLMLTIWIPESGQENKLDQLPGKLSRLHVLEWHSDNRPAAMRATLIFREMPREKQEQLERLLLLSVEDSQVEDAFRR